MFFFCDMPFSFSVYDVAAPSIRQVGAIKLSVELIVRSCPQATGICSFQQQHGAATSKPCSMKLTEMPRDQVEAVASSIHCCHHPYMLWISTAGVHPQPTQQDVLHSEPHRPVPGDAEKSVQQHSSGVCCLQLPFLATLATRCCSAAIPTLTPAALSVVSRTCTQLHPLHHWAHRPGFCVNWQPYPRTSKGKRWPWQGSHASEPKTLAIPICMHGAVGNSSGYEERPYHTTNMWACDCHTHRNTQPGRGVAQQGAHTHTRQNLWSTFPHGRACTPRPDR
jgi:hypothetical protein